MHGSKRVSRRLGAFALMLVIAAPAPAGDRQALRERFVDAYEAMIAGRVGEAERLAAGLEHYPLLPYLRYEYLRRRLHRVSAEEVRRFLVANEDSVLAERLRTRWLEHLARRQQWSTFIEDYRPQRDTELQCTYLLARVRTGATEGIVQDALALWLVGRSQPPECDPAFERLYASPVMDDALLWQRIALAMEAGQIRLANWLARKLPAGERHWLAHWRDAHHRPAGTLRREALAVDTPVTRRIVAHGIKRLARRELVQAARLWDEISPRYDFEAEVGIDVMRTLALRAARDDADEAAALLDALPAEAEDEHVQRARLRTAIRTRDWVRLARWTEHEPVQDMSALRWRYWRARALEELGKAERANAIYRLLAQERDYYGFRAADRLGVGYAMRDQPLRFTDDELAGVRTRSGIVRALELHAIGYHYYARREWLHETRNMAVEELEKAALIAHRAGWHDRAILTVGRAQSWDHLALRFPMPYESLVMRYAAKRDLPPALVFAIMRTESAFIEDARSPAGALGLMQVMPATGRRTARDIGYRLDSARSLLRAEPNVTLGSAYLKQMLERYGGNLAMAAAAYNAGPHRVRAWQPDAHCQAAEDWIELVPYRETRRYVRRALFYTAIYEWRLAQRVAPLHTRLAAVPALRAPGSGVCDVLG